MLSKERIQELLGGQINSVSPLDFIMLCQQAEYAVDLESRVSELESLVDDTEITKD